MGSCLAWTKSDQIIKHFKLGNGLLMSMKNDAGDGPRTWVGCSLDSDWRSKVKLVGVGSSKEAQVEVLITSILNYITQHTVVRLPLLSMFFFFFFVCTSSFGLPCSQQNE